MAEQYMLGRACIDVCGRENMERERKDKMEIM